ncbi:TetR/AcrR family transcriptional regulator [Nocardia sp. NRRL S-836]|uniref:TetR/AcrR family transcriptional regulator n=1 Tax=Nocardia sp. NRRL S-836 TaxID=1519492 RepID=UPI0006AED214|nr:TetR/AcrR family transcriptional regulator [Nocardia sp. NRRL S-836]KOV88276.1 TetR family transcriptional regulator [Nocardia sp. NRRL S-836]
MNRKSGARGASSREEWATRIAALEQEPVARKEPITVDRIVGTALRLVETDGYAALTMRRVAAALGTGPASLYAHVRNKAELDDLLIGTLSRNVALPAPDAARWRDQFVDVCGQLREEFLRYPGIAQAALSAAPNNLDTLRITEGMLAILLAGGVGPQQAAWTIDAALLYVSAYTVEASLRRHPDHDEDTRVVDRAELVARLRMLPVSRFPHTVEHADKINSGEGHERFDFALRLLLRGL